MYFQIIAGISFDRIDLTFVKNAPGFTQKNSSVMKIVTNSPTYKRKVRGHKLDRTFKNSIQPNLTLFHCARFKWVRLGD